MKKNVIFNIFIFISYFFLLSPLYSGSIEDLKKKLNVNKDEGKSSTELKLDGNVGLTEIREGVIYVPANYDPKVPSKAILLLKWYDGWPKQITEIWMGHAEHRGYILIAPGSSGRSWGRGEKSKIMRFLSAVMNSYNIDKKNIMVFGHSVGAQMALKIGLKYQKYFKAIVLCACNYDKAVRHFKTPLFSRNKNDQPRIYIIQGGSDKKTPPKYGRKTRDKLLQYDYDVTYKEIPGLGHVIPDSELYPVIDWFESFNYRE
ncbi:MAG: hypothetical protein KAI43_12710 [Candidatus Aureabacteria bacterium]|nr:hypothetical protein [Candidatus Auribacterota bacterium]